MFRPRPFFKSILGQICIFMQFYLCKSDVTKEKRNLYLLKDKPSSLPAPMRVFLRLLGPLLDTMKLYMRRSLKMCKSGGQICR